jgi:hypothetical protein
MPGASRRCSTRRCREVKARNSRAPRPLSTRWSCWSLRPADGGAVTTGVASCVAGSAPPWVDGRDPGDLGCHLAGRLAILAVELGRPADGRRARSAPSPRSRRRSSGHGNAARTTRAGPFSAGKTCMATRNESSAGALSCDSLPSAALDASQLCVVSQVLLAIIPWVMKWQSVGVAQPPTVMFSVSPFENAPWSVTSPPPKKKVTPG